MFQTVLSCVLEGLKGSLTEIECAIQPGFPCFHILGLSASNATASHEKLLAALKASGFSLPQERITLNVRPPRFGQMACLDLGMAAGILCAQRLIPETIFKESLFVGELSLDGNLLPLSSSYYYALWAKENGYKRLIMPAAPSGDKVPQLDGFETVTVDSIKSLVDYLRGKKDAATVFCGNSLPIAPSKLCFPILPDLPDLNQIQGQEDAKRALIIAVAGFHNLLLVGPPGIGKSMLASASIALLTNPSPDELREIQSIHALSKETFFGAIRPLRAPHHTIPPASFLGGGSPLRPGEISLAHRGILFLDEVAEYPRSTLEALRLPLENHSISLDRLKEHAEYPADFMLLAGMNPCPCGFYPDMKRCHCSETQIANYQKRVSGPLSDRIDMIVWLNASELSAPSHISTKEAQAQIQKALERAQARQGSVYNARIPSSQIENLCHLTPSAQELAQNAFDSLALSMRGYHRFLRVARTIADLSDHDEIEEADLLEAMHYSDKSLLK